MNILNKSLIPFIKRKNYSYLKVNKAPCLYFNISLLDKIISLKSYDKRDGFDVNIVGFPFLSVLRCLSCYIVCVYISQFLVF